MLSITRHLAIAPFAIALFASPAFAHTHLLGRHHAGYRHHHHRELSALRHRRAIASRYARYYGRRDRYAFAPDYYAAPNRTQYAERRFAPAWNMQPQRERTAFARRVEERRFFGDRVAMADSAASAWQPSGASFGAWHNARYDNQGFGGRPQLQGMAEQAASANGVPLSLVDRVIKRESGGNARAVSRGNYGLMQIRLGTARAMGYRGSAAGLLDPTTNMTYAVRYLAGAYRAAGGNESRAVALYARGYNAAPRLQYASYYGRRPETFGDAGY